MEWKKSYDEIIKLLKMMNTKKEVFKGSDRYLSDENTPVISDAAVDLAKRVEKYSPENPLYVVAIGAITNIASAILLNAKVAENTILVADKYAKGKPWTRVIWDVTAVAWILNDNERFMNTRIIKVHMPTYDYTYENNTCDIDMSYVYHIKKWRNNDEYNSEKSIRIL